MLGQIGQKGVVSISGDILNPSGHDPGQPAQEDSAGLDDLERFLPT